MLRTVRAIAVVATLLVVGSVTVASIAEWTGPPAGPLEPLGFSTPTLAVALLDETEGTAEEIEAPSARDQARWAVTVDFSLIAGYWLLFVLLAALIAQRHFRGAWLAAFAVLVTITLAAGADVMENQRLLHILDINPRAPDWQVSLNAVRQAASWRWIFLFVATALVAPVFFGFDDEVRWGVGLTWIATGVIGLAGVRWYTPAVAWAFGLLVLGVSVLAVWCMVAPQQFVESTADGDGF